RSTPPRPVSPRSALARSVLSRSSSPSSSAAGQDTSAPGSASKEATNCSQIACSSSRLRSRSLRSSATARPIPLHLRRQPPDELPAPLEDPLRVVVQGGHVVAALQHHLGDVGGGDPAQHDP